MKKNYLVAMLLLIVNFASAQIDQTPYRGAFAPAPAAPWTDSWTNLDPKNEPYPDAATVVNVTTNISVNTTWTTGKTYKISGLIYVIGNATLTIQPGVVVKGVFTNSGTALIITKGAKLNAIGTATQPIVFTSAKTVVEGRQSGDWGGIVLLGKAGFNTNNGINNIEGITANVNTEYGGGLSPINNDNSGTLKYVRIEFGGYVFSPNNEINGLTMGAVGNGTTIDYVQVSYANDDAFEWFGGSVNCKHIFSYRNLDDDFDTDNGYKGVVQYAFAVRDPSLADNPSVSTSEGFESDNNPGGTASAVGLDTTSAIFTNVTMVGPSKRATLTPVTSVATGHERALRLRRATQLKIYNSIFMDFKNTIVFVDGSLAVGNATTTTATQTLRFRNNILAGNVGTFTGGVNPNNATMNTWFSSNGNTTQASSTGVLAAPYDATTNTYFGLDYRPGTAASSGSDFSDSFMAGLLNPIVSGSTPSVANLSYCKGVVAPQLTATLTTTGVSLKWYTVATGGTASTTAPTPLTTIVGVKNYYVSQVDGATSVESSRVLLTVTTLASPTEVLGAIVVGTLPVGATSGTTIGNYVGTTTQFSYSIPAFVDTTLVYLWTVPLGVNIVSGQGTNTLTVNFANVPFGAGAVGSIQIQAVNTSGCKTLAKALALTKALPLAPTAINMYNKNPGYATPLTAITTYAKYMGSTTELTLTATPVVGATLYQWDLPAGVSVVTTGTPVTTNVTYTAEPFFSPASTPSGIGTKYWVVTFNTYALTINSVPTTVTVSTASQKIFGNTAYGGISSAPYLQYGTVVTSNNNSILVKFAGVTSSSTTALYLGVRSRNGVGLSVTSNTLNADVVANNNIPGLYNTTYTETITAPIAPSTNGTSTYTVSGTVAKTSKLKKLTAAIPVAPTTLKLTNDAISTITGVTVVTTYIGTTTPLTLTAAASATASSYSWELPAGVNQIAGGNTNVITINFAGVASGITSLYLGVKAVNAIGSSITSTNGTLVPATSSTAKLLKVTAGLPAAPTTLTLTNPAVSATSLTNAGLYLGTATPLTLTAAVSVLATSYSWELPFGVTQISGGNTNIITVNLAGVTPGTVTLYFGVKAVNAVGSSITTTNGTLVPATTSTAKLLKITNTAPAAVVTVAGTISNVICGTSYSYTLTPSALASSYVITAPTGSVVTSASNLINTTNVLATSDLTFSVIYPSNLATVTPKTVVISSVNGFGSSATNKTLTITAGTLLPVGTVTGGTTFTRCATKIFSIPAVVNASTYTWTPADGAVIVSGQGTTSVVVDFAAVPLASITNLLQVIATNSCGVNTTTKSITLTSVSCFTSSPVVEIKIAATNDNATFSNAKVYPNPAMYEFNIDIDASRAGDVQMTIYTLSGSTVMNPKTIKLDEGRNTINENVSSLSKGIYIVRLTDASDKEVMVKKLIKE